MEITCYNCKNTWDVPSGNMRSARLRYALGYEEYKFTCPNCGTKNILTREEFQGNDYPQNVIPVTSRLRRPDSSAGPYRDDKETARYAPTNPVEAPGLEKGQRQAVVQARGVEARRDHSDWAEIMGAFSRGERIAIVDTWTDGEQTWVQLGPERWVNIEQDGEPALELLGE